ncbi:unnamed protein product [Lactuca saligna]|uniref:Uncharacterized protein n=1 Tax=Lactuca saligna TaxID=75948 RepID=A0AA35Y8J2_LACSI|nr:unnamed protein product [Lactuca saligna]
MGNFSNSSPSFTESTLTLVKQGLDLPYIHISLIQPTTQLALIPLRTSVSLLPIERQLATSYSTTIPSSSRLEALAYPNIVFKTLGFNFGSSVIQNELLSILVDSPGHIGSSTDINVVLCIGYGVLATVDFNKNDSVMEKKFCLQNCGEIFHLFVAVNKSDKYFSKYLVHGAYFTFQKVTEDSNVTLSKHQDPLGDIMVPRERVQGNWCMLAGIKIQEKGLEQVTITAGYDDLGGSNVITGENKKSMESSWILENLKKKGIDEEIDKEILVIAKKGKDVSKDLMLKLLPNKFLRANGSGSEVTYGELYRLEEFLLCPLIVLDDSGDGFTKGLEAELASLHSKGFNASVTSGGYGWYITLDPNENGWEVVKKGGNAQVIGEVPHKFKNVFEVVRIPSEGPSFHYQYFSSGVMSNKNGKVDKVIKMILEELEPVIVGQATKQGFELEEMEGEQQQQESLKKKSEEILVYSLKLLMLHVKFELFRVYLSFWQPR